MQRRNLIIIGAALAAVLGSSAYAQGDKSAKQAEIKTKAMQALEDFYKADPKLKDAVAKAPGYAVFTTFGLSFGLGGAGGKGLAHDNVGKKDVYMNIAQASAGLQIGASDSRYLFIFSKPQAVTDFIEKGWDASASASAGAGAGTAPGSSGKTANAKAGAGALTDGKFYVLTKSGLQAGAAVSGVKAWKDGDLN